MYIFVCSLYIYIYLYVYMYICKYVYMCVYIFVCVCSLYHLLSRSVKLANNSEFLRVTIEADKSCIKFYKLPVLAKKAECAVLQTSGRNKDTWLQFITIFFG